MASPLLIWDGECGFCRRSVEHLRARAGDRIAFLPYQEARGRFPGIPVEELAAAVHLVETDGRISRGAEAIYRSLACTGLSLPLWAYRWVPGVAAVSEWGYRMVAAHRSLAARVVSLLVGDLVGPPRFRLTRFVFLRLLALVYMAAFLSLAVQVHGLIGEHGLLPALGWLGAGDTALSLMCYAGAAAALLALVGFAQGPLFAACFVLYLSLVHLGQDFLAFQWDALLLETGFLALLLAPWRQLRPRWPGDEPPPPMVAVWLLRLLLFKLMFSSGLTKLTWGDPTWHDLTALSYHYWTQPLPTALAWWAARLSLAVQRLSCAFVLGVELVLPLLIFAPRRPRRLAFAGCALLQVLIAATGNYGFFNLLTLVLCVPLLDDQAWPAGLRGRLLGPATQTAAPKAARLQRLLVAALAVPLVSLSIPPLVDATNSDWGQSHTPRWLRRLAAAAAPLELSNAYGLFRTMTTTRPELEIEGSRDGQDWLAIPFRYKPGDPARAPRFPGPHMPRLDWQMWFAALQAERLVGDADAAASGPGLREPWLERLLLALLRGEPQVLALLGPSPFGRVPPRYVRLVLWQYRFADAGAWWARRRVGLVAGPFTLPSASPSE